MNLQKVTLIFLIALSVSCGKLSSTRARAPLLPKFSNLEAKDLTKLSIEEAIKTKYAKIEFVCSGQIDHEVITEGVLTKETKLIQHNWNLKEITVLNKTIKNETQLSFLSFILEEQLTVKMDEKFNTSIIIVPKYEIKVFAEDGITILQMIKNNSNKMLTLNENQKVKFLDILLDSHSSQAGTKINLECSLKTVVNSEYKAK